MVAQALTIIDKVANTNKGTYSTQPNSNSCNGLVLHATGSKSEAGDEDWLAGGALAYSLKTYKDKRGAVSINYLLHRDGTFIKMVPDNCAAWHAGWSSWHGRPECNTWCIGIEICNDDSGEPYTDAQYEAVSQMIVYLCKKYKIDYSNVTTHAKVRAQWLSAHPNSGVSAKHDPYNIDVGRIWRRVFEIESIGQEARIFPETGRAIDNGIKKFFESNGDVGQFGFPISPVITEHIAGQDYLVQYTQRSRFEYHSDSVLLGLVGNEALILRGGSPTAERFHSLDIEQFHRTHGGIPILGLPISAEIPQKLTSDTFYVVQYFERARIERHIEGLMLGLVGYEVWASKYQDK